MLDAKGLTQGVRMQRRREGERTRNSKLKTPLSGNGKNGTDGEELTGGNGRVPRPFCHLMLNYTNDAEDKQDLCEVVRRSVDVNARNGVGAMVHCGARKETRPQNYGSRAAAI